MSILDIVRASGGKDVIIPAVKLNSSAWGEPTLICAGFDNLTAGDENGQMVTYLAAGLDVSLPKKSNDGNQTFGMAVDNVRGDAQRLIDLAKEAQVEITVTLYLYLESDLSAPAERPYVAKVLNANMEGPTVNLTLGYFDLINSAWPRDRYTLEFAPGLAYL